MTHKLTLIALVALMMFALPASAKRFGKHSKERTAIGQLTVGQEYRLVQPVFVVRYPAIKHCALEAPRTCGSIPASINDYLEHPDDWMEYLAHKPSFISGDKRSNYPKIIGIVSANTKIRLTSLRRKRGALGMPRVVVLGRIGDIRFVKQDIDLNSLMHSTIGYDSKLQARPEYLVPWTETSYAQS